MTLTDDVIRLVRKTRLAQGLPEKVEDQATLDTIATLLQSGPRPAGSDRTRHWALWVDGRPVPQPAKAVLAMQRITNREVCRVTGFSDVFVGRSLNGYVSPSAPLRRAVAELTHMPEADLFRS